MDSFVFKSFLHTSDKAVRLDRLVSSYVLANMFSVWQNKICKWLILFHETRRYQWLLVVHLSVVPYGVLRSAADNISSNLLPPSSGWTKSHIHNEGWTADFFVIVINTYQIEPCYAIENQKFKSICRSNWEMIRNSFLWRETLQYWMNSSWSFETSATNSPVMQWHSRGTNSLTTRLWKSQHLNCKTEHPICETAVLLWGGGVLAFARLSFW